MTVKSTSIISPEIWLSISPGEEKSRVISFLTRAPPALEAAALTLYFDRKERALKSPWIFP